MLSDPAKLVLLCLCFIGCLATLFTSPGLSMGNAELRSINPPVERLCKKPREEARKCVEQGEASCKGLKRPRFTKCENAISQAYKDINMGGCPHELKVVTLCEAEWCQPGASSDRSACKRECGNVREALQTCIQKHVGQYFSKHGLESDGTIKKKG
jgi:hypothetical protein